MTEQASSQPVAASSNMPMIIYILFLVSFITGGLSAIVGVVLAHMNSGSTDPVLRSHFSYQIRTFWWGFLWIFIGGITSLVLIGYLVLLAWAFWAIYRCCKGINSFNQGLPV